MKYLGTVRKTLVAAIGAALLWSHPLIHGDSFVVHPANLWDLAFALATAAGVYAVKNDPAPVAPPVVPAEDLPTLPEASTPSTPPTV